MTLTSPNLFDLLGVSPELGRGFTPAKTGLGPGRRRDYVDAPSVEPARRRPRHSSEPKCACKGGRITVIGVLPRDFTFVRNDASAPPQRVDAYIPFEDNLAAVNPRTAHTRDSSARAAAHRRARWPPRSTPSAESIDARDFERPGSEVVPGRIEGRHDFADSTRAHGAGAAGMVLVFMLMVNLASVLLARVSQREHELAVSRALGANTAHRAFDTARGRDCSVLPAECSARSFAIWGTKALVALAPLDLPRREAIAIDWRIAAAVITVGSLLGILAAAAPAVWAARTSLSSLLAGSAVRGGGGQSRWRRGMIVAQVALSLVLLSSGALVVRSFERLLRADPGFGRKACSP